MKNFIDALASEHSKGKTENEAVTFTRTESNCLDFFSMAGAMRSDPEGALYLFQKAFAEDRLTAIRILFYLRDIRDGQGERHIFRTCLKWLANDFEKVFDFIIKYVPKYGRWDDMFFIKKSCFEMISFQLFKDSLATNPSFLAKWLPTINSSNMSTRRNAKIMAKHLGLDEITYRRTVRKLRKTLKVVEELMSANKWNQISYNSVPSQASLRYKDAFYKHDKERYTQFLNDVETGKETINTGTLYPYQIYDSIMQTNSKTAEALWTNLPDYTQGNNAIVVADVSGSMLGRPMSVSVSLALYFAERNRGEFNNHFITFSSTPKLQRIVGITLNEKMRSIETSDWGMTTNLQAVFDLVLDTACKFKLVDTDMPATIYVVSDMEFDMCSKKETNFEAIKNKYANYGYKCPNIVFWNVDARTKNVPVQKNEQNVTLISGYSPTVFELATGNKTPEEVMFDIVRRYENIVIRN
jgi:hypothetical protein